MQAEIERYSDFLADIEETSQGGDKSDDESNDEDEGEAVDENEAGPSIKKNKKGKGKAVGKKAQEAGT